ncbi:MAG TPA: glycosyltransferase family 4 protein [Candidatus Limnocylindria bacterium]|nr:glycosyltransferase family 4 protein [Candidatus Limnocylindria bacterium]
MRIAVLCPHFEDTGGVREVVARLAQEHVAAGHRVDVVSRASSDEPATGGGPIPIWRVPMAPAPYRGAGRRATKRFIRRFLRGGGALAARVRALAPDVIAVHCSKFYAPWVMIARAACRAPVVLHLHNAERTADGPPSPFWSRRLLGTASRVIAVAPAVADFALRTRPALAGRVVVIRNGVDPGEFDSVEPERREGPYLLAVGRLAPQKGFDVLLDALAMCRHTVPLVIAGDGPDRAALAARAARLGPPDRVVLLGDVPRTRVRQLLRGAALVLMPSRFEGNPLIAIEAMQAGAPLIASDIPGLPPELRPGETGYLVPPEDPAALAAAIDALLDDASLARRLGAAAAQAARDMPAWPTIAAEVLAVYDAAAHSM